MKIENDLLILTHKSPLWFEDIHNSGLKRMKNYFKKSVLKALIVFTITLSATIISNACNLNSINVIGTPINNCDGTYTITVEVCLGVNVNWGAITSFTLTPSGGTYTSVASIQTSTYTTSYNYCDSLCGFMNNCSGAVLTGGCNSSISFGTDTITVLGCGNGVGNWLVPNDNNAICIPQPDIVCDSISFTTNGYPTNITLYLNEDTVPCTYTLTLPAEPSCGGCAMTITSLVDTATQGNNDGAIDITVSGGTLPYNYSWSTGDTTENVDSLIAGAYTVIVTDSLGCIDSLTIEVPEVTGINQLQVQGSKFKVYPNPFSETLTIEIKTINDNLPFSFTLYDPLGRNIKQFEVLSSKFQVERKGLSDGIYIYRIMNSKGDFFHGKIVIQ